MSKRRILLVTNDLGPRAGGIETFILGLLERIDGKEVVIFTSSQEGSPAFDGDLESRLGVKVIRDQAHVLLPTPRVNRAVLHVMHEYESEVIWFGAAMPLAWMSGLLKKNGAKRVVAISHGHEVWWSKLPPFKWIFARSTRSIDYLTYLGDFTRTAMQPVVSKHCQLVQIAPGIDTDFFTPGSKDPALVNEFNLQGKRVIVCVGRLVHRKGQDRLVEAMPEILSANPDAVLLFVGIGPRKAKLDQLIAEYSIENSVRFVGRVNYRELPKYFRLGDVFAMPSRSRLAGLEVEGLGIVYLEASACGIPVLGGTSGGAPDAVQVGITGQVVDGTDISAIAQAINVMFANPTKLKEMGRAGRDWAISTWSWNIWGEKFRALLG